MRVVQLWHRETEDRPLAMDIQWALHKYSNREKRAVRNLVVPIGQKAKFEEVSNIIAKEDENMPQNWFGLW